jgi:uncharacterized membrane protein (DUF485 family)
MPHPAGPTPWGALAAQPAFRTLVRSRRRFVLPAAFLFLAYYLALPIAVGWLPNLMNRPALGPVTLAWCFAVSQFAMAWLLLAIYLWRARSFDLRAAQIRRQETHELLDSRR